VGWKLPLLHESDPRAAELAMDPYSPEFNDDVLVLPEDSELSGLEGGVTHGEGLRLSWLASRVPGGLAIVELGAYRGKSACFLGAGSRAGNRAPVFSIDSWDLRPRYPGSLRDYSDPENFRIFKRSVASLRLESLVFPVKGFSTEIAEKWKRPIGLLFIDAGHSFKEVLADYEAWSPFLIEGGIIVFHDYDLPGVKKAVEEIVKPSKLWSE